MDYNKYFADYSENINKLLKQVDTDLINKSVDLIKNISNSNNTIYLVGNGGSASIASHVSTDFAKVARVSSKTFNDSNLITCFANDYGYENWVKEAVKAHCSNNDLLILISSSGKSLNIINAAKYCKENNIDLITFSGFEKDNELCQLGNINFHVDSKNYNFVEMTHHIILVSIVDIFVEKIL